MKKRITALVLAVCMMLCLLPVISTDAQAAGLNFISINDTLLDYTFAYYSGSSPYVPASIFSVFGIYFNYFTEDRTASLWTNQTQLYFEIDSGNTYDAYDNFYSASALALYGTIYVPVSFVCQMFGLSWSYIEGNSYGSIVRIKTSPILSDEQFLSAARQTMQSIYNSYYGLNDQPSPTPSPTPTPEINRSDTTVYLCFAGVPDSQLKKSLSARSYHAAFFLTAEQVSDNADAVRSLVVEGYGIGVWYESDEQAREAMDIIADRTRTAPLLISSSAENAADCARFAQKNGLAHWQCAITAQPGESGMISSPVPFTSLIEPQHVRADVLVELKKTELGAVTSMLIYLASCKYTIGTVRETTAPEV